MLDLHTLFQIAKHSYLLHTKLLVASTIYYTYYLKYQQSINDHFQQVTVFNDRIEYKIEGKLHRENDLPAVIYHNGTRYWYKNGVRHRDNDLPAIIWHTGNSTWYNHGRPHRDNDLPAIIRDNRVLMWYKNGELHRDNDLPTIIRSYGALIWHKNCKLHRENKAPSIIHFTGTTEWYKHGEFLNISHPCDTFRGLE